MSLTVVVHFITVPLYMILKYASDFPPFAPAIGSLSKSGRSAALLTQTIAPKVDGGAGGGGGYKWSMWESVRREE